MLMQSVHVSHSRLPQVICDGTFPFAGDVELTLTALEIQEF